MHKTHPAARFAWNTPNYNPVGEYHHWVVGEMEASQASLTIVEEGWFSRKSTRPALERQF